MGEKGKKKGLRPFKAFQPYLSIFFWKKSEDVSFFS